MTDNRAPLPNGASLSLGENKYVVRDVIGRGGSSLAYIAESGSDLFVIKEFYPVELTSNIMRNGGILQVEQTKLALYNDLKKRFINSARVSVAFYGDDSNHSLPPATAYEGGNAAYSSVPLTEGATLAKSTDLSIYEIAQVMISVCNAVEKLHIQGKLYLDVKPDNVFLFNKEQSETRRIALFDFDTVTSTVDVATSAISFSPGWSPYEQEHSQNGGICASTDVYSIGATFYWLISGVKVSGELLTDIENDEFTFLDNCFCLRGFKNAQTKAKQILTATLRYSPNERAQTVSELIKVFVDFKDLAQPNVGALGDKQDETLAKLDLLLKRTSEKVEPDVDTEIANHIISVIENNNTMYMVKEHDYHEPFERQKLDALFALPEWYQKPSNVPANGELKESIDKIIELIKDFRWLYSINGGPMKHDQSFGCFGDHDGTNSHVETEIKEAHEILSNLWKCYAYMVSEMKNGSPSAGEPQGVSEHLHSLEYFNLFVFGDESIYAGEKFIFLNEKKANRVLNEGITDAVREKFGSLSDSAIEQIKTFPCLFLSENNGDSAQVAYYGFIDEIMVMDNGINVYFRKAATLQQKDLRDIAQNLAMENWEFTRTHWTIKRVNLAEELTEAGLINNQTESTEQTLSQTLQDAGFDAVFTEVPHSEAFGLIDEKTCLKMFHLDLSNNLFSYGALQEFLVDSIGQYVFSRAKIDQLKLDGKIQSIAYKALGQLRSATGGNVDLLADELGGILLYAFLEQVLKAPKLFSRVELVNNGNPNIVGNSGIHLCSLGDDGGVPAYQMVFGKSRIEGNLEEAIDDAFVEIEAIYNNAPGGLQFVESTVFTQSFDQATTERLKNIIIPSKTASVYMDKAFSVFLGYPFGLDGKRFTNSAFRAEMNMKMQDDIKAHVGYIAHKIKAVGMENCSFYIYTLPFNDAVADKRNIMTALMEGK